MCESCLGKQAWLKRACIDDDAEDDRDDEVVSDACSFPNRTASPGASPWRRRTERDVPKDSPATQGVLLLHSGQSQFKHPCLMMASIELWETYECSKPGQVREECSVRKKRSAEKGNNPQERESTQ